MAYWPKKKCSTTNWGPPLFTTAPGCSQRSRTAKSMRGLFQRILCLLFIGRRKQLLGSACIYCFRRNLAQLIGIPIVLIDDSDVYWPKKGLKTVLATPVCSLAFYTYWSGAARTGIKIFKFPADRPDFSRHFYRIVSWSRVLRMVPMPVSSKPPLPDRADFSRYFSWIVSWSRLLRMIPIPV
jgi:hypothetical protein